MVAEIERSGARLADLKLVDEWECLLVLETPDGRHHRVKVEATPKGNGGIWLTNLFVRTQDSHDDGVVYEPACLAVCFRDVDQDGATDLVVSGSGLLTDEMSRAPVRAVFRFDPIAERFQWLEEVSPVTFAFEVR